MIIDNTQKNEEFPKNAGQPFYKGSKQHASKNDIWIGIRLPKLPIECLGISPEIDTNIVISHQTKVCASTDDMVEKGVHIGMPISTAKIMSNTHQTKPCRVYPREVDAENITLKQLCNAFYKITPYIQTYTTESPSGVIEKGLLLEVSRCIRLFKGLDIIVHAAHDIIENMGMSFHCGQGHTKEAAWLLSYGYQNIHEHYSYHDYFNDLSNIEISSLYGYPKEIEMLKKMGFFSLRDVFKTIEEENFSSLKKRFHSDFCDYILNLYIEKNIAGIKTSSPGATPSLFSQHLSSLLFSRPNAIYKPTDAFLDEVQFEYPVRNTDELLHPMTALLEKLQDYLVSNQKQTPEIIWIFYDIYKNQHQQIIHIERFHQDYSLAIELTLIALESNTLPFEVDRIELSCSQLLAVSHQSESLISHHLYSDSAQHVPISANESAKSFAISTAKIKARIGEKSLFFIEEKNAHIPELSLSLTPSPSSVIATKKVPDLSSPNPEASQICEAQLPDRPSWLFKRPEKINVSDKKMYWKGELSITQGPERIESLWWKKHTSRDYFVVKRKDNTRLWIFHDNNKQQWYVHGVFA